MSRARKVRVWTEWRIITVFVLAPSSGIAYGLFYVWGMRNGYGL